MLKFSKEHLATMIQDVQTKVEGVSNRFDKLVELQRDILDHLPLGHQMQGGIFRLAFDDCMIKVERKHNYEKKLLKYMFLIVVCILLSIIYLVIRIK